MSRRIDPSSPLAVAAVQLGMLLLMIYYTFIGGQTALAIYDASWRAFTFYLTVGLLAVWLLWRWWGEVRIPRTPLDWPLLLLVAVLGVTTYFSVTPVYSLETLVFLLLYIYFFYAAADLGRWPWLVELLINAIIATAGLVWMFGLLQMSWWYQGKITGGSPDVIPRLSVLGNPNTMASYIALVIPLVLYKLAMVRYKVSRFLLVFWLAMLVAMIILTRSRGGLMGMFVAAGFFSFVWLLNDRRIRTFLQHNALTRRGIQYRWVVAALGLLALAGVVMLLLNIQGTEQSLEVRLQMGRAALLTWQQYPLFGSGLGTLGQLSLRTWAPGTTIWADAHNLFLTLAAETGFAGLISLLWLVFVALGLVWRYFKRIPGGQWHLAGLACFASWLGFMVHNLVDYLVKYPVIMIYLALLGGLWVITLNSDLKPERKVWQRWVTAAAGLLLAVTLVTGYQGLQHLKAYNQAVDAAMRGDWTAATGHLQQAVQLAPAMPFYQRELALAAGFEAQRQPTYRDLAIENYQAALQQVPWLPVDHANLACLLWQNGQTGEAISEMTQAHQMVPTNLVYHFNLVRYLVETGQINQAQTEIARLLAGRPDWSKSSYWTETADQANMLATVMRLGSSEGLPLSVRVDYYLTRGELNRARQLLVDARQQPDQDQVEVYLAEGLIALAADDLSVAQSAFSAAHHIDPEASESVDYLSQVYLAQDQTDLARQTAAAALAQNRSGRSLFQAGRAAETAGEDDVAIGFYEEAFAAATADNKDQQQLVRYAIEVARRRPMPVNYLPCLARLYPTRLLIEITLSHGRLLDRLGDPGAAIRLYQQLLDIEPGAAPILSEIGKICKEHGEICSD